jgi:hypothetical protein|tara:strand:+ start:6098 stop:6379 length:282 start_codon:yes stop_codon:yes gene_type:complete
VGAYDGEKEVLSNHIKTLFKFKDNDGTFHAPLDTPEQHKDAEAYDEALGDYFEGEHGDRYLENLAELNDNKVPFKGIAAFVRKFPEAVFEAPA